MNKKSETTEAPKKSRLNIEIPLEQLEHVNGGVCNKWCHPCKSNCLGKCQSHCSKKTTVE